MKTFFLELLYTYRHTTHILDKRTQKKISCVAEHSMFRRGRVFERIYCPRVTFVSRRVVTKQTPLVSHTCSFIHGICINIGTYIVLFVCNECRHRNTTFPSQLCVFSRYSQRRRRKRLTFTLKIYTFVLLRCV